MIEFMENFLTSSQMFSPDSEKNHRNNTEKLLIYTRVLSGLPSAHMVWLCTGFCGWCRFYNYR